MNGHGRQVSKFPAPDRTEQLLAAEDLVGVLEQKSEEVELANGERQRFATLGDSPGCNIQMKLSSVDRGLGRKIDEGAAKNRFDPQDEFPRGKRLREIVVGSGFQPVDPVVFFTKRGKHENRHGTHSTDAAAHLNPVYARQHTIKDDEIGAGPFFELNRRMPVARNLDDKFGGPQVAADDFRNCRVIVHHEDTAIFQNIGPAGVGTRPITTRGAGGR